MKHLETKEKITICTVKSHFQQCLKNTFHNNKLSSTASHYTNLSIIANVNMTVTLYNQYVYHSVYILNILP